jgi:peptidoglycan-associated lipoprotein
VAATRITIVSYGEERPLCSEHTESCWAQNRRAHFLAKRG